MPRHFLTGTELAKHELERLVERAIELKADPRSSRTLAGRTIALVFEAPSTRTRITFEVGIVELGGHPMILRAGELQLSRGYVGDGNNVARSLALIGTLAGLDVVVSSPAGYELEEEAGARLIADPEEAVRGAHAVYTDVWVSMGDEATAEARRAALEPYRIDDALLDRAAPGAVALHCLPAHIGEEITESVLYGGRQRIWDQAENRRHAQKALLELLVA
ncbi:MAG: hypothetical protein LC720_08375 [Actinobacteria bacterium]|nr:hypothetical protein [Actinomycetota bacterium]